jgi:hypothetical protein
MKIGKDDILYIRSKAFIDLLRKEASDAKSCVTQYSFQSLALSGASIGFILNASKESPLVMMAVIPMILILIIVMRIAVYKYELANRAYGYELHLQTITGFYESDDSIQSIFSDDIKAWKFIIENEHWERTYFVWKIIHPALFSFYYHVDYYNNPFDLLNPNDLNLKAVYKNKLKNKLDSNRWFLNGRDFDEDNECFKYKENEPDYHAGGYLSNILNVMKVMQYFLLAPLLLNVIVLTIKLYSCVNKYQFEDLIRLTISCIGFLIIALFFWIRIIKNESKFNKFLKLLTVIMCILLGASLFYTIISSASNYISHIDYINTEKEQLKNSINFATILIGFVFIFGLRMIMGIRVTRRERILDKGLNSVRSASLIWSVVFRLHYMAWNNAQKEVKIKSIGSTNITAFSFEQEYQKQIFDGVRKIIEYGGQPEEWIF